VAHPDGPCTCTFLGRFDVDDEFAGKGLGRWLLARALRSAYDAGKLVSSALIVLDLAPDATPSAVRLSSKIGSTPLASDSRRMVLAMDGIARSMHDTAP